MHIFTSSSLNKLRSQEEGSTIIEYAIVAPVLFLLVFAILEFSMIMYAQSVLSNATTMASRFGMTGDNYATDSSGVNLSGDDRVTLIKNEIEAASFGLLKSDKIDITTDTFIDYSGGADGNDDDDDGVDDGCDFGQSGEAVMYNISYVWNIHTPMIGKFFEGGAYNVKSNVLVLNEEFVNVVDSSCT